MNAITAPAFYLQHQGELSIDGLGWVWQSNLFSHYVLVRARGSRSVLSFQINNSALASSALFTISFSLRRLRLVPVSFGCPPSKHLPLSINQKIGS